MENYKGEVWITLDQDASNSTDSIFAKGELIEKVGNTDNYKVKLINNNDSSDSIIEVNVSKLAKSNPTRFDGYDDMASLTFLNEPSVLNNLKIRYSDDKIYTYSGLFLVTVNPYKKLNIYNTDFINLYANSLDDTKVKPHIFETAQKAYQNLINNKKDQSILVTGESGAGKTENTKKVIQYILSVSAPSPNSSSSNNTNAALILENQILQANPILESFGNATTVRNLNSSRFGKFIKIKINPNNDSKLSGAHIDWYLLEKSRVIFQDSKERNYHVFYQLLKGANSKMLKDLLIDNSSIQHYQYLKNGLTDAVENINDKAEFKDLIKAFKIMNLNDESILNIFKILSIILHLGNINFKNLDKQNNKQAVLTDDSEETIDKIAKLLGVTSMDFKKSFLNSKMKVGREIVNQQRTAQQAKFSIDALAKTLYEKLFQYLIDKINENFKAATTNSGDDDDDDIFLDTNNYIGILDIAGFEIFEKNSFEQLCINYTNEKLQQFFNHHMFVLEQSEYLKEGISWKYIDFGNELKPTIELIEGSEANKRKTNIFSILNEECVVPKASDKTFIEKLFKELEVKDTKNIDKTTLTFRPNKIRDGFIIKHYAGNVDYSIDGWLDKNKDPLSSTMVELLSNSQNTFINDFFNSDDLDINLSDSPIKGGSPKKTGMFRTVAKRHKEQLNSLMDQLSKTYPHFVRCILPNNEKKPGIFNDKLVLHQLRCNGVLEGIRIARSGYPNRIDFKSFANQYSILLSKNVSLNPSNNDDYKQICELILDGLDLDSDVYKIGLTKLFFRNGVLANLDKMREEQLSTIFTSFNSLARGFLIRKNFQNRLQRFRAAKMLITNFQHYANQNSDPWFKLVKSLKPRLDDSGMIEIQYTNKIKRLEDKMQDLVNQLEKENSEHNSTTEKVKTLEGEIQTHKSMISKKDSELDQSKEKIVNLEKELSELTQVANENSTIIKEKEKELVSLSKSNVDNLKNIELEKAKLNESVEKLQTKLKSENKVISTLKDEITSLKSTIDNKEMELSSLKREKRSKDTEIDNKIKDLQSKLNAALDEKMKFKSELSSKSKSLELNKKSLTDLQNDHSKVIEELKTLREKTEDYDAKKLAYDQSEKIKKKFKQLKHEYNQTKSLLEQKVKDEVEFNKGRQQYNKELEETKSLIKGLQNELEVEKRSAVDLDLKLQQAKLETERAIKVKKSLEMDNAQLKLRLQNVNPMQASMNQLEVNKRNNELTPEVHQLREEVRLLRTRLASESYENRNLKAVIKKGGISLANLKLSGIEPSLLDSSDGDIKIFNDDDQTVELREKLEIEKEANKRLQGHYVQLQKDLIYYKSKMNNSSDVSHENNNDMFLLDVDSMEYKSKFQMSEIEISDLKEQIKDLRLQLKKNENNLIGNKNILSDATNVENNVNNSFGSVTINDKEQTKLKHENLRLSSALNELRTKLNRIEQSNGSRFEQEEEIIQLRGNLKTLQLKNGALTSSVELYKGRSEDYYSKLSKAEVELQSSIRERGKLQDEISHLKDKLKRYELKFEESDNQVQLLNNSIRDLEKKVSDKDLQIEQLNEQCESLKDKFENSEELRKSVKSVNHEYQEAEINRLRDELSKSVNKETEMSKLLRSLNLQIESSKKEINTAKFNNNELFREKNVLKKALNDCMSKNERLLAEVKENILKVQNLSKQVNVLKVTNGDLLTERDDLLNSKRSLEDKLNDITLQFDEHLSKVRISANNEVLATQLGEKLSKAESNLAILERSLEEFKLKNGEVNNELLKVQGDYMKSIEENKELTKFNKQLMNKLHETENKLHAELKAQELHWSKRIAELDEKLFMTKSLQRNEGHKFDNLSRTIKELEIRNKDLERSKKHSDDEIRHLEATIEKLNLSYDSLNKREMEAQLRCKQLSRECQKFRETVV